MSGRTSWQGKQRKTQRHRESNGWATAIGMADEGCHSHGR